MTRSFLTSHAKYGSFTLFAPLFQENYALDTRTETRLELTTRRPKAGDLQLGLLHVRSPLLM